jgi:hypothetical protein
VDSAPYKYVLQDVVVIRAWHCHVDAHNIVLHLLEVDGYPQCKSQEKCNHKKLQSATVHLKYARYIWDIPKPQSMFYDNISRYQHTSALRSNPTSCIVIVLRVRNAVELHVTVPLKSYAQPPEFQNSANHEPAACIMSIWGTIAKVG